MNEETLAKLEQLIISRHQGEITTEAYEEQKLILLEKIQPLAEEITSEPVKWNDFKKFWIETLRTIVITGFGIAITLIILNPTQSAINKQADTSKWDRDIKTKLADQFLEKSFAYTEIMYDVDNNSTAMDLYENSANDSYNDMKNRLGLYFKSDAVLKRIEWSNALSKRIHTRIKNNIPKSEWNGMRERLALLNKHIAIACLQEAGVNVKF